MRRCALLFFVILGAGCPDSDDPQFIDAALVDAPIDGGAVPDAVEIDGPFGSNPGFIIPTAVTKANMRVGGAWTELGDANWSCLGTPSTDPVSTGAITLTGRLTDFQTGNGVGNGEIFAWSDVPTSIVGTGNSSDAAATRGDFSMTLGMLPPGVTRYSFTILAPSFMATRVLGRLYQPGAGATDQLDVVSEATATALPAFIGVNRDPTRALYIGTMRDCDGHEVSNAVVGISLQQGTFFDGGGETFYFSAGSSSLPVRHNVAPVMNKDGLFTVINTPPGILRFIQVWGFRTTAELNSGTLTLLAEVRGDSEANLVVSAELEPRRN